VGWVVHESNCGIGVNTPAVAPSAAVAHPHVDLLADSIGALLAVAFPKNRSPHFPIALQLAAGASKYCAHHVSGIEYHFAVFARTHVDAARAVALLKLIKSIKGVQTFVDGRHVVDLYRLQTVIDCYLQSCACADPRAHCHSTIPNPIAQPGEECSISRFDRGRPMYVWPCALMLRWNTDKLQAAHPSSIEDQLQARAVAVGCHVCPNFRPELVEIPQQT
jgi:hypothetical protein